MSREIALSNKLFSFLHARSDSSVSSGMGLMKIFALTKNLCLQRLQSLDFCRGYHGRKQTTWEPMFPSCFSGGYDSYL